MRKRGVKSPDRAEALMLAFADRTPAITRYYEHRVMAAREAERTGMPIGEVDASELWDAYNSVRAESYCPKCGGRLGPQKTMGSDGKYYHPECQPLLSWGR